VVTIVPISYRDAAAFVAMHHRHLDPPIGHKFSIGAVVDSTLVGVAMVGRPVARRFDNGQTLEVNRTATDGTRNVNSLLYGAAWRATKALGYTRLITYTQGGETGASLRAAGWVVIAQRPERPGWDAPSRPRTDKADLMPRTLWEAS
jgi:hypothetical protein